MRQISRIQHIPVPQPVGKIIQDNTRPRRRHRPRRTQRLRLRMRPPAGLGPAAPDDDAILDDDRADGGIRPGTALPAPAERQRKLHVTQIFGHWVRGIRHDLSVAD
mgnify:CR=1 FL=1